MYAHAPLKEEYYWFSEEDHWNQKEDVPDKMTEQCKKKKAARQERSKTQTDTYKSSSAPKSQAAPQAKNTSSLISRTSSYLRNLLSISLFNLPKQKLSQKNKRKMKTAAQLATLLASNSAETPPTDSNEILKISRAKEVHKKLVIDTLNEEFGKLSLNQKKNILNYWECDINKRDSSGPAYRFIQRIKQKALNILLENKETRSSDLYNAVDSIALPMPIPHPELAELINRILKAQPVFSAEEKERKLLHEAIKSIADNIYQIKDETFEESYRKLSKLYALYKNIDASYARLHKINIKDNEYQSLREKAISLINEQQKSYFSQYTSDYGTKTLVLLDEPCFYAALTDKADDIYPSIITESTPNNAVNGVKKDAYKGKGKGKRKTQNRGTTPSKDKQTKIDALLSSLEKMSECQHLMDEIENMPDCKLKNEQPQVQKKNIKDILVKIRKHKLTIADDTCSQINKLHTHLQNLSPVIEYFLYLEYTHNVLIHKVDSRLKTLDGKNALAAYAKTIQSRMDEACNTGPETKFKDSYKTIYPNDLHKILVYDEIMSRLNSIELDALPDKYKNLENQFNDIKKNLKDRINNTQQDDQLSHIFFNFLEGEIKTLSSIATKINSTKRVYQPRLDRLINLIPRKVTLDGLNKFTDKLTFSKEKTNEIMGLFVKICSFRNIKSKEFSYAGHDRLQEIIANIEIGPDEMIAKMKNLYECMQKLDTFVAMYRDIKSQYDSGTKHRMIHPAHRINEITQLGNHIDQAIQSFIDGSEPNAIIRDTQQYFHDMRTRIYTDHISNGLLSFFGKYQPDSQLVTILDAQIRLRF